VARSLKESQLGKGNIYLQWKIKPHQQLFIQFTHLYDGVLSSSTWDTQEDGPDEIKILLERSRRRFQIRYGEMIYYV
jgi:hypothetical protein